MGQSNFMDEMDCESFFDHIEDFIDFPADDIEGVSPVAATITTLNETNDPGNYEFPECVWSAQCNSLPGSASDLSAELSVPYEDIVQLEWLSNFVEDSFSGGSLTMSSLDKNKSDHQFHSSSPVSVLESSSSCSGEKASPRSPEAVAHGPRGRARSKRPRPATFTPRPTMQLVSPTSSLTGPAQPVIAPKRSLDGEGSAESRPIVKIRKPVGLEQKKKKKIKITNPAPPVQSDQESSPQHAIRQCMHCEITKTPQWRAGPMGPKTLCNACGVRFKSGRLYPEYRPAASPTFVPALHSNSHKKVLEMRNKDTEKLAPNSGNIPMVYM